MLDEDSPVYAFDVSYIVLISLARLDIFHGCERFSCLWLLVHIMREDGIFSPACCGVAIVPGYSFVFFLFSWFKLVFVAGRVYSPVLSLID